MLRVLNPTSLSFRARAFRGFCPQSLSMLLTWSSTELFTLIQHDSAQSVVVFGRFAAQVHFRSRCVSTYRQNLASFCRSTARNRFSFHHVLDIARFYRDFAGFSPCSASAFASLNCRAKDPCQKLQHHHGDAIVCRQDIQFRPIDSLYNPLVPSI